MNKKQKLVWKCINCGGTNVQIKQWVYPNSGNIADGDILDREDTWCEDCEDNTGIDCNEVDDDTE